MKRNHFALLLTLVAVALLATSCDTLFTNQFKVLGLGQVTSQTISTAVAQGDTATIIAQSGLSTGTISDSFIAAVTSSTETTAAVLSSLETTATTSTVPATVEAAEVLIVQINLETSGAKTMIDNIVTAISSVNFAHFDVTNATDLNNLLTALFPPRSGRLTLPAGWTSANVATIVDVLISLDDNFAVLVANLVGGQYLNSGVDAGWIAQVGTFISVLKRLTPKASYATTGAAVAKMIDDFDLNNPTAINPSSYVTIPSTLLTDIKNDAQLSALFGAAGMNLTTILEGFGL
jgi:hypothetical protein